MFDFRYHALSLVAVFMALMLGILLGVAIGDKGLISGQARQLSKGLEGELHNARGNRDKLEAQLAARDRFEQQLYPLIVQGRLSGQRIGLIALGNLADRTIGLVRDSLKDTGGRLTLEAVIHKPVTFNGLSFRDTGVRGILVPADRRAIARFARRFGAALTQGGALAKRARRTLFSSSSGAFDRLDGIVLVREEAQGLKPDEATISRAFEAGLASGLAANDVPVVGIETVSTDPSQVPWFKDHRLSSVDDVDRLAGRVALVFALAGANGSYGVKPTAEAVLPRAASGAGAG